MTSSRDDKTLCDAPIAEMINNDRPACDDRNRKEDDFKSCGLWSDQSALCKPWGRCGCQPQPILLDQLNPLFPLAPDTVTTRGPNEPAVKDEIENRRYMLTNVTFQVGCLTRSALLKRRRRSKGNCSEFPDTISRKHPQFFMIQLPVAEGVVPDGVEHEQPLFLDGVNQEDFQQLLRVMFPK